jgi:hypothetical protein
MTWYPWIVFGHVLASFIFVLAHGVSVLTAFRVRGEREPLRIAAMLDLSGYSLTLVYLSLLVTIVTGVVLGFMGDYWGQLWIWLSIGLLAAVLAAMFAIASPYYANLRRSVGVKAYGDSKDAPPPEVRSPDEIAGLLASARPFLLAAIGGIGLAVIIWLMIFRPF